MLFNVYNKAKYTADSKSDSSRVIIKLFWIRV